MQFQYLKSLLDSATDREFIDSLSHNTIDKPYLVETILKIINDDNRAIPDNMRKMLFRMCRTYFNTCLIAYIDQSAPVNKLEKLISGSESVIYYTTTATTDRVATANEVKNGIAELRPVVSRNITEDIEAKLNLLLWTFNGLVRYYMRAGLKANYDERGLVETPYQLILNAAVKLRELTDWMEVKGNYDKTIAVLRSSLKNAKNYRYPTFATDEILPDISVKQVIYKCKTGIRGRGATDTQFKALQILRKLDKNDKTKLTPGEISILRKSHIELENGFVDPSGESLPPEVDSLCGCIEKALEDGIINEREFALKIVKTVRQRIKCSDKQLSILLEARDKIEQKRRDNKNSTVSGTASDESSEGQPDGNSDANELMDMYSALGSGVLQI